MHLHCENRGTGRKYTIHFKMRIYSVCLLIVHTAFAIVSIQVQNNSTFIELGRTDIGIRCLVNDSEIERIITIQLLRSNTHIVSVNEDGISWQDEELKQRAVADSSVMNSSTYYLDMTIDRQMVTKNDGGNYSCISSVQYRSKKIITNNTRNIFLNITEIQKNDTNDVCGYQLSQTFIVLVLIVAVFFNHRGM